VARVMRGSRARVAGPWPPGLGGVDGAARPLVIPCAGRSLTMPGPVSMACGAGGFGPLWRAVQVRAAAFCWSRLARAGPPGATRR